MQLEELDKKLLIKYKDSLKESLGKFFLDSSEDRDFLKCHWRLVEFFVESLYRI